MTDLSSLIADQWQTIDSAPRDGTNCLFYSPGNSTAWNGNAVESHISVDRFSERWPRGMFQYPEAPYTHWMPLPSPPRALDQKGSSNG